MFNLNKVVVTSVPASASRGLRNRADGRHSDSGWYQVQLEDRTCFNTLATALPEKTGVRHASRAIYQDLQA